MVVAAIQVRQRGQAWEGTEPEEVPRLVLLRNPKALVQIQILPRLCQQLRLHYSQTV